MKKSLIECYYNHAFTHDYIFGVAVRGTVYMVKKICNMADMEHYLTTQTASRGQGQTLKFAPTTAQKVELIADGESIPLCSVEYLENLVANSKYNRGQMFEKLVTELYGTNGKRPRRIRINRATIRFIKNIRITRSITSRSTRRRTKNIRKIRIKRSNIRMILSRSGIDMIRYSNLHLTLTKINFL